MNLRRKQQLRYVIADLISSELVWLCFLIYRWMVYDGRFEFMRDALIPAFSFWLPLLVYPVVCLGIYYLSGYYLRPFQKPIWRELMRTFISAAVISLLFFFIIIIDDEVESYNRYLGSLGVHAAVRAELYPPSDDHVAIASIRRDAYAYRTFDGGGGEPGSR